MVVGAFASSVVFAADPYPSKAITLIVPFASGGSADILARVLANTLTEALKQPVIIDNRTGAGGLVGTSLVAKAPADGYTLLLATDSLYAINPALYGKKAEDAVGALTPVAHLAEAPLVIAVNSTSPANDFSGLLKAAKASGAPMSYGTPGVGTDHHLLGELIAKTAGVKLSHVPYRGAGAALGDIAGGQIDMLITLVSTAQPMVAAGKIKLIGVATTKVYEAQPQLSRMGQTLPGTDMLVSYSVVAPKATPAPVVARLNEVVNAALRNPTVSSKLSELGLTPTGGTVAYFAKRMEAERQQREGIIRDADVKLVE
jgi:tripartite-type tricarboxylate transporter receptor subunit TctC